MTSLHRPLSSWVARVYPGGRLGTVNDGRERADARELPWFATDWTRVRVPAGRPGQPLVDALGLVEDRTGAVVAELDNGGVPLPVSVSGLATVADAERGWPAFAADERWAGLRREPLQLRHLLLKRLVAEATGPLRPDLFHMLDWDRVDELTAALTAGIGGRATDDGPPIALRHWFAPAVRGLTAALEQFDAGRRAGNVPVRRQGFTSLVTAIHAGDVDRLPAGTRTALAAFVTAVAVTEPMYVFAARAVTAALAGATGTRSRPSAVLEPEFPPAAAGDDRDGESQDLGDLQLTVTVTMTAQSRLILAVSVAAGDESTADDPPTFLEVQVRVPAYPADGGTYWVALRRERDRLVGAVDTPLPRQRFEVVASDLPVGASALRYADAERLLDSIRVADFPTTNAWLDAADRLPPGHAVRAAARMFEEEL